LAETIRSFPAVELEKIRRITPIQVKNFEQDRDIMIQNIITKDDNQLVEIQKEGK
jgi:hypothetical protein